MVRLTSSSLAGTTRTLVAVGTDSEASMLATMRAAAPRKGTGDSERSDPAPAAGVRDDGPVPVGAGDPLRLSLRPSGTADGVAVPDGAPTPAAVWAVADDGAETGAGAEGRAVGAAVGAAVGGADATAVDAGISGAPGCR